MIKEKIVLLATALAFTFVGAQASPQYEIFMDQPGSYLGVSIRDVTSSDVQALKLPREAGVYVESVSEGSPAEKAQLAEKDVITEFDGFPVIGVRQFRRLVSETPAGRDVDMTVWRNGQAIHKVARLEEAQSRPGGRTFRFSMPEMPEFGGNRPRIPDHPGAMGPWVESRKPRLGISGVGLTGQMAQFLGVPGKEGVLVLEVTEDSPAAKAGLRAGDVITSVGGKAVSAVSDISAALRDGVNKLEIVRDKKSQTVEATIAAPERGTSKGDSKKL
jgi:serine protease Do